MAKKVYNGEIKARTSKPKVSGEAPRRNPVKFVEEKKKYVPSDGLDSYAYGLDNNIILF